MRKVQAASPVAASPRKRVLVMVSPEFAHGRAILRGIGDYEAHHARWQFVFEPATRPEPVKRKDLHGMIVEVFDDATGRAVQATRTPTVRVTGVRGDQGPPTVTHDNHAVGRMGAHHLADLGLRDLAFVTNTKEAYGHDRAAGFAEACQRRRLTCHMCDATWRTPRDERRIITWLKALPKPVGMMASNDRTAFDLARLCQQIGILIPEQMALLGVDNEEELCRLSDPPLSSIDHDSRRVGYEAAKLLDRWMTTGRPSATTILAEPLAVVSRKSTDLLAVPDAEVRAALRFIRLNAGSAIKTREVLQHIALCRRSLEMRFQKAIGRTIHAEIMRVKIERARQLLITSDWSMPQIADACGFACASQLSHVFKREAGQSPMGFRQQFRYVRGD